MTLATAQALAARGFSVFPIKAGAKYPPLWKGWPDAATTDVSKTNWPLVGTNVGIHCKGFVVLDVDVRSGGDDSLAKLELVHDLPPTLTTRTPTGGRHLFYRLPAGHPGVTNGANKLGPGIDIKSTSGYVVAPGSEVEAGRYRFEADVPIADAPEWLVQKLDVYTTRERVEVVDVPDAGMGVMMRAADWLDRQPKGDDAFRVACGLRDFGLSLRQTLGMMYNHDGRGEAILRPKVEHAYRYAQNAPGSKAASPDEFPLLSDVEQSFSKRERKKLVRLVELAAQSNRSGYLVKGLLQLNSHTVIYGQPGAGKTFIGLDLAYHVAAGDTWQERRVKQGVVLYLAYEGIGGMVKRAAALARHYGTKDVPLYIVGADYNLRDVEGRRVLAEDMAQLPDKPILIVIDTLARAMKGGDENSAQDMGALNDAVSALIKATGACVVLVHHSGKNKAHGARGSSALLGAIDTEVEVDSRQIITRKQRDIEPAMPLAFKLSPICVGMDEDGDEIMSCFVESAVPMTERTAGLGENDRLGLDVLVELSPENEDVDIGLWRAKCLEFLPQQDAAARKSFYRIKRSLEKRGLVEKTPEGRYRRKLE